MSTTTSRPAAVGVELVPRDLEFALYASWDRQSSAHRTWGAGNPPAGQCAVTALIVQDYLGGELVRVINAGESHYFNRVAGTEVDLTRAQFDSWDPSPAETRTREYVLSSPDTASRYDWLRRRVAFVLDNHARAGAPPTA